jgi:hypothetical protein
MVRVVRRVGIAIGSLVAAWLAVSLVGGFLLPAVGVSFASTGPGSLAVGTVVEILVAIVVGALIYRDIIRRDQHPT